MGRWTKYPGSHLHNHNIIKKIFKFYYKVIKIILQNQRKQKIQYVSTLENRSILLQFEE